MDMGYHTIHSLSLALDSNAYAMRQYFSWSVLTSQEIAVHRIAARCFAWSIVYVYYMVNTI